MGTSYPHNAIPIAGTTFKTLYIDDNRSCKTTDIKNPARMITIGEEGAYYPTMNPDPSALLPQFFRHVKYMDFRFNVAFADGHAKFTRFTYSPGIKMTTGPDYTILRDQ